ncbi:AraC family transcriptional regulator [Phenylobacterium sp.]|uniref:helix-turn-helix domain-containing protein n=1 Tax=Phenylobacterium sp. TaxID=1871053 RepID=UPI0025D97D27|nr:AraC family transcriptional regulator [Phenylobacterium sp.]
MYRCIKFGVDRLPTGNVARHIHREGYATIILSGGFIEAAFAGRVRAEPGMALLHGAFDCHANVGSARSGPTIIRLPWRGDGPEGPYRVSDPDLLARLAERDPVEAACALEESMEQIAPLAESWSDRLAEALRCNGVARLRTWADQQGLSPSSVSRGFREAYQVSPQRFQLEARTRMAWRRIVTERTSLTSIAHECAFSDLAHMSRSVAAMMGAWPTAWRNPRALEGRDATS